jgi:hypothetical protein
MLIIQLSELLEKQLKKIYRDIPVWLSLIIAGRPWPASEASAANHHPGDLSGSRNRYESSPNILSCILGNASQKVELII